MSADRSQRPVVVASAGIAMVGVSFGMGRYGFGLLAPDIRATFGLSSSSLGLLSSASYAAYIAASLAAAALVLRAGPRAVVMAGGLLATGGMLLAAAAGSAPVLFAGLLVAGASAGLAFPPFSDVAGRLDESSRSRVLAAVNAGTGWGVALAVPIALLAGERWRAAWLGFAVVAALATVWAAAVLPRGSGVTSPPPTVGPEAAPERSRALLGASLLVGLSSSVFWTFAVDHVERAGALTATESRLFLAVVGLASVAGTLSAHLIDRLGARRLFVLAALTESAALVTLGAAPGHRAAVFASAVLFGAAYNTVVAVTVIWSQHVHARRPSGGLASVMVAQATGLLVGPPVLGAVADRAGFAAVFGGAGALLAATSVLAPAADLRSTAASRARAAPRRARRRASGRRTESAPSGRTSRPARR